MRRLFLGRAFLFISFLCSISLTVEAAEWLGEYAGSEMPGYVILKSNLMGQGSSGGPTDEHTPDYGVLAEKCKKNGGKAIVNVRFVYALGDVSWKDKNGSITKISPGAFGIAYGDCVYEVKPRR